MDHPLAIDDPRLRAWIAGRLEEIEAAGQDWAEGGFASRFAIELVNALTGEPLVRTTQPLAPDAISAEPGVGGRILISVLLRDGSRSKPLSHLPDIPTFALPRTPLRDVVRQEALDALMSSNLLWGWGSRPPAVAMAARSRSLADALSRPRQDG